jgi:hypothetical protein
VLVDIVYEHHRIALHRHEMHLADSQVEVARLFRREPLASLGAEVQRGGVENRAAGPEPQFRGHA